MIQNFSQFYRLKKCLTTFLATVVFSKPLSKLFFFFCHFQTNCQDAERARCDDLVSNFDFSAPGASRAYSKDINLGDRGAAVDLN